MTDQRDGDEPADEQLCDPETCDCICHTDPSIDCTRDKYWIDDQHPDFQELVDALFDCMRSGAAAAERDSRKPRDP